MEKKPWYRSKTIWFMIGTLLVATANELAPILDVVENEQVRDDLRTLIVFGTSIGGVILRLVTAQPVRVK